jgi:thioredoxin 1
MGLVSINKLNQYLSNTIVKNAALEIIFSGAAYIDSAFDFEKNGLSYQVSFLEFGANGCVTCSKMESVMAELEYTFPEKVNVVFLNILKPDNQMLMRYYGVAAIPTQILLDNKGKEFFRHYGFISTPELTKKNIYHEKTN